jgi:hypothetical protein
VRNGTVEPRIDDIALIPALEQVAGLMGTRPVRRQPVEHDIETKAQAASFAQGGYLVYGLVDRPTDPQTGAGLARSLINNGSLRLARKGLRQT